MDYKKSYLIKNLGILIGLIIFFIGFLIEVRLISYIGIILMISAILQTILYYKCPNCNNRFNVYGAKSKHCPECGYKLDELHFN